MAKPLSDYPWFKFHVSKFITETISMSDDEVGKHIRGIAKSWINNEKGSLPKWMEWAADERIKKTETYHNNRANKKNNCSTIDQQLISNCSTIDQQLENNTSLSLSSSSFNSNALMQGGAEWAAFKNIYPSQRGVYDPIAEHRFAKIVKDGKLEIVMHNVQWYANYIKYAGDSFVTQAAKWFESGACFEDWEPRARHAKSLIPREQLPVSQRPITDFL